MKTEQMYEKDKAIFNKIIINFKFINFSNEFF